MSTTTATASPAPAPARAGRSLARWASPWASEIGITAAFVALWFTFVAFAPTTFTSERIYLSFAQTTPFWAISALFLTMVIICGDMDLSFPSEMALGMVGFIFVWQATGSTELGVVAAILTGALCGLFNGLVTTIIGIPSLVVTIGTQFLFRGLALILVNGKSYALITTNSSPVYTLLVGKLFDKIPMEFPWLVVLAIVAWVLLNRHRLGQNAYIIGDNKQTAQLMGIPIRRTRIILFMLVGMAAALGGCMDSLAINNFYPSLGESFLLLTLAAVFIGGTSVFGGRGSVYGTVLGAFMVGAIQAGIVAMGLTDYYTGAVYGAIVLIAVSIHALMQRRFV